MNSAGDVSRIDLSVIIPATGSVYATRVGACLATLAAQHNCWLEIILVQSHTDELASGFDRTSGIRRRVVVDDGLASPSSLRNEGALEARGRFLFFCDADILLPESFCARTLQWLSERPSFVLTCPYRDRIFDDDQDRLVKVTVAGGRLEDHLVRHGDGWFYSSAAIQCPPLIRGERHGFPTYAPASELLASAAEPRLLETCFRGELWGGCLITDRVLFDQVAGYSELYNGWGHEDADLKAKLAQVATVTSISEQLDLRDLRVFHLEHPMPHKTKTTYEVNTEIRCRRSASTLEEMVREDLASGYSRYIRELRGRGEK